MNQVACDQLRKNKTFRVSALAFAIQLACIGAVSSIAVQHVHAQSAAVRAYQIPAGSLATVLNQFAAQSGTSVVIDAKQLNGKHSLGLSGHYSVENGFQHILAQTEFSAVNVGDGYALQQAVVTGAKPVAQSTLTAVAAVGQSYSDDGVIQLTPMTVYGTVSRDIKGQNEVYDADISSVYAGKEQIERYKGAQPADLFKGMVGVYSGDARNSGALDPSVRGVQGPGRVPVIIDGTEQAITVWRGYNGANNRNYIDPNLIGGLQVIKGPSITRNVNTGVGGAVVINTLSVNDVLADDESFGGEFKVETSNNAVKPTLRPLLTGQSIYDHPEFPASYVNWQGKPVFNNFYDPSLFKKTRTNRVNNIYSGDDVAGRIALAGRTDQFEVLAAYAYREKGNHFAGTKGIGFYNRETTEPLDYIPYLAKLYPPGAEVPNSSLKTESYLFKAAWKPTDDQRIEFGYRDTHSLNGEILPSRIAWTTLPQMHEVGVPQWPLSEIKSKAYTLEYKYQPEHNQWVDFYSNIWRTDTTSHTYSSGGFPNQPNLDTGLFTNTAVMNSENNREGVTISNKISLLSNLNLTLGGSYQREKLTSLDDYADPNLYNNGTTFVMRPRAGERVEKEFNFNFDYKPTTWLSLSAGARYNNYWAFDNFLNDRVKAGDPEFTKRGESTSGKIDYYTQPEHLSPAEEEFRKSYIDFVNTSTTHTAIEKAKMIEQAIYSQKNTVAYYKDSRGKFTKANNPYLNGSLDGIDYRNMSGYQWNDYEEQDLSKLGVQKTKDHAWAPSASATINFSPNSRVYLRYSEAYRMPSLFESTIGFSSGVNVYGLAPEHAYNTELAYVHNLSGLFKNSSFADIKLAYYHNKTKNVMERDPGLVFSNVDSRTIEGLELQSRFDNGRFFTDISANYRLKNTVCDEHSAMIFGMNNQYQIPECVDDGFIGGYLVTMAEPKYSINWTLGGRFLDEKLEIGTRLTQFYRYESVHKKNYGDLTMSYYGNVPLSWDTTLIVDAYANYRLQKDTQFELLGTNLTDMYYIDPLTRSTIAAPGRTVKLSITHKF